MPVVAEHKLQLQLLQANELVGSRGTDESAAVLTSSYIILDSSNLWTFVIAIVLVVYGCFRSMKFEQDSKENENRDDSNKSKLAGTTSNSFFSDDKDEVVETMDTCHAILLPFGASASLLVMFYFFDSLQLLFAVCTGVLATIAFAFLLLPLCHYITRPMCGPTGKKISFGIFGRYSPGHILSCTFALIIVGTWIVTGHWLLMDALGMGLCVAFITYIRLPSLKVSTLLLMGLLLYDLFWVFCSSYLFNTNVMMKVATRSADNPLSALVKKLNLNVHDTHAAPKLSLPGKLVFPSTRTSGNFSMLGLGDIVLPGLVLCFVLRYDVIRRSQLYTADAGLPPPASYYQRITYFHCSLVGYFLGLLTATISSQLFNAAQPALLYLVPFTLLPLVLMAYLRGDLRRMWSEPFQLNAPPKPLSV